MVEKYKRPPLPKDWVGPESEYGWKTPMSMLVRYLSRRNQRKQVEDALQMHDNKSSLDKYMRKNDGGMAYKTRRF